ncbi:hypothetical protein V7266_27450 [Neobacillus drentensis]|uniref:hypothetical protein n=1 Tax=Neobacillus drentensis TaxID=220684 RepID=UPI002FFF47EF
MKYEQIEELLQFTDKEIIFMPNEIFNDLKVAIPNSSSHLAFAYSYTYLTTWIYRYAKHLSTNGFVDNIKMKEILGYNQKYKKLDYLIKKHGLLDQLGYTQTVKDFPTTWTYDEFEGLEFGMYSTNKEYLAVLNLSRKFTVKYPVKAFNRYEQGETDGTFYQFENTHSVPFEVFVFCVDNDQLGTIGFYLYSYIKRMNDIFIKGWDVSLDKLAKETSLPETTLDNYIGALRKYRMIEVKHNQEHFSLGMRLEDRKANTYKVNGFHQFSKTPQPYEKIKVLNRDEYKKVSEALWGKKADIELEQLPY